MVIKIEIQEDDYSVDYNALFDFIDSDKSAKFLDDASNGRLSFRSAFDHLIENKVLPRDSSKRIWTIILLMYRDHIDSGDAWTIGNVRRKSL